MLLGDMPSNSLLGDDGDKDLALLFLVLKNDIPIMIIIYFRWTRVQALI